MGLLSSLAIPVVVWILAYLLGRRELRAYRGRDREDTDLFVYSRARIVRRMIGIGVLVAVGGTLGAWDMWPPKTPQQASLYVSLLLTEVIALVVIPILDMWETARTSKPADLTRQADPDRRTRTKPRRPR